MTSVEFQELINNNRLHTKKNILQHFDDPEIMVNYGPIIDIIQLFTTIYNTKTFNNNFHLILMDYVIILFEYNFIYNHIIRFKEKSTLLANPKHDFELYLDGLKIKINRSFTKKEIKKFTNEYIYLWILFHFNNDILNIQDNYFKQTNITDLFFEDTYIPLSTIIPEFNDLDDENKTHIYIKSVLAYILYIYTQSISNNYITIPQYHNNCWFISMITGICYSDMSKQLILNNIHRNKNKIILSISEIIDNKAISFDDIKKQFITFVYYIILNISYHHRKYDDMIDKNKLCEIFKIMKSYPQKFLQDSFDYYKSSHYHSHNELYWIELLHKYGDFCNPSDYGCSDMAHSIIVQLYKYLNINAIFVYYYKYNDTYLLPISSIYTKDYYDIIIIATLTTKNLNKYKLNIDSDFIDITIDIKRDIIDFDIDYIIHGNDTSQSFMNIGHDICGLHYNNTQFYHNSATIINTNSSCGYSTEYDIPCSFIQYNWKDNINGDIKHFCIQQCSYKNIDIYDKNWNTIIKNSDSENICFNNLNDIIYIYIKRF